MNRDLLVELGLDPDAEPFDPNDPAAYDELRDDAIAQQQPTPYERWIDYLELMEREP